MVCVCRTIAFMINAVAAAKAKTKKTIYMLYILEKSMQLQQSSTSSISNNKYMQ